MKSIAAIITFGLIGLGLVACSDDGGGGNKSATTPYCDTLDYSGGYYYNNDGRRTDCRFRNRNEGNLCIKYYYDYQRGHYVDRDGRRVDCRNEYINSQYGTYPYYTTQGVGCEYWSQIYSDVYYPVNLGYGMVCVSSRIVYQYYPDYQQGTYLGSCYVGVNCGSACGGAWLSGGGEIADGIWLQGSLGLGLCSY